jgi:predicted ArsR family transcriptional regulator
MADTGWRDTNDWHGHEAAGSAKQAWSDFPTHWAQPGVTLAAPSPRGHAAMNPPEDLPAGLSALPPIDAEILIIVNDSPGCRAELVSERVFLSVAAARQRIARLEALGFVAHQTERRGTPGRPEHRYVVTASGRELFSQGRASTLLSVLSLLQRDHPAAYAGVLASLPEHFRRNGPDPAPIEAMAIEARTESLLPWIRRYGHRVSMAWDGAAGCLSVTYCAALEAATQHPGICEAERGWLASYFPEMEVTLDETLATGGRRCQFRLSPIDPDHQPK